MSSFNKPDYINFLLGALAHAASSRGSRLTKIRLVKFLYLFDLFWAQSEKRTFTNWAWAFIHYGPYCRESTDAIDIAEKTGYLTAESYESMYGDEDFRLYRPGNRISEEIVDKIMGEMPIYVASRLFSSVKRWYDDTYGLLDYVYFQTGPMEHAQPGEILSFENQVMPDMEELRPVKMLPLSNTKKRTLRETIKKMESIKPVQEESTVLFDKEYFAFIDSIADPETEVGLTGVAKLNFERSKDD